MTISRTVSAAARVFLLLLVGMAWVASHVHAQTVATLGGQVVDESGAVLHGVVVTATSRETGLKRDTSTSADGHFTLPPLPPGKYVIIAQLAGFQTAEIRDVVLNVSDQRALRIDMKVIGVGETVHVDADAARVTTSPAVSTVVDRQFVANLPLSGRSLQSLLELTPGVTLFKAQPNAMGGGQFSVNGQRTNANYFMVDGVSANTAINTGSGSFAGHSASGALPGLTALGSTQSLVSIDALQEFRVQTSTYAPEFGRMPGGQISMLTRSGSNAYHGSLSEYFRHDAMDAADWFANQQRLVKPKLRQNDFGGTLGGPIVRGQTFFFASYEGLRLDLPQVKTVAVPTMALRQQVPADIGILLNAFPLPNAADLGGGLANFAASYSDPSRFDTTAVRVDHAVSARATLFGRYSHAPSLSDSRVMSLNTITRNRFENDSVTVGTTWILGNRTTNDLRVNGTWARGLQSRQADSFGGAVLPPQDVMFQAPTTSENALFLLLLNGTDGVRTGTGNDNVERQFNIVDTLTFVSGRHNIKLGLDYRYVSPILTRSGDNFSAYSIGPVANALAGRLQTFQIGRQAGESVAVFQNLSAFVQDSWSLTRRFTLLYGVRWELNPPPGSSNDHLPLTIDGITGPEPVRFAPRNTPLYETTYNNVAPRIGAAYQLSQASGRELLLRGGFGIFHDTGFGEAANGFDAVYPFFVSKAVSNVDYPLSAEAAQPPVPGTGSPQQIWMMDRHLRAPYTYQWHVSVEQNLGSSQTLTMTYVGSAGRRQLYRENYSLLFDQFGTTRVPVFLTTNASTSDYKALQIQFQRRLTRGLQGVANYTLSSSHDTVSDDSGFLDTVAPGSRIDLRREYGPSDFDARHVFTGGLTWDMPSPARPGLARTILGNWGADGLLRARSAFPLTVLTTVQFPPTSYSVRPDLVPGVPQVLTGSQYPGGKAINVAAFSTPAPNTAGTFPRNSLRGFGAQQVDLTLRRRFALSGTASVQLRFELFNAFNHPNFADPSVSLTGSNFGVSTQMLNRGLGSLNALYQMGGPRSAQISAKLQF